MLVTSRRFNSEKSRLNDKINKLEAEKFKLLNALICISTQRTSGANATVTRMADIADDTLNRFGVHVERTEVELGTLADIGRSLKDANV